MRDLANRTLLGVSVSITAIGGLVCGLAAWWCRATTGLWLSTDAPDGVLLALVLGCFVLASGVLLTIVLAVLAVTERLGLLRLLSTEVATRDSVVAKVGRGVLTADHAIAVACGVVVLAVVGVLLLEEPLTAALLLATLAAMAAIYKLLRRRHD